MISAQSIIDEHLKQHRLHFSSVSPHDPVLLSATPYQASDAAKLTPVRFTMHSPVVPLIFMQKEISVGENN